VVKLIGDLVKVPDGEIELNRQLLKGRGLDDGGDLYYIEVNATPAQLPLASNPSRSISP